MSDTTELQERLRAAYKIQYMETVVKAAWGFRKFADLAYEASPWHKHAVSNRFQQALWRALDACDQPSEDQI